MYVLRKSYFWKGKPNYGACAIGGKKAACKRKINVACKKIILTMIGLGFLVRL
jgi:hypothetical protein